MQTTPAEHAQPNQPAEPGRARSSLPRAVRLREDHWRSAAERLVAPSGVRGAAARAAAERFLMSAEAIGIDMRLSWGVLDQTGKSIREVCLAVLSPGRAAMLLLSGTSENPTSTPPTPHNTSTTNNKTGFHLPTRFRRHPPPPIPNSSQTNTQDSTSPAPDNDHAQSIPARYPLHAERVSCILAATDALSDPAAAGLPFDQASAPVIAQALLEIKEHAGLAAFTDAGYIRVGQLAYLRANTTAATADNDHLQPVPTDWPSGIRVLRLSDLPEPDRDKAIIQALERTYEGTLDCPELCGLRSTTDVLDSHKSVGEFDPALWWIVMHDDQPAGCSLLNVNPPLQAAELVYFGLSPAIRGKGLASPLLRLSMAAACRSKRATIKSVLCAVDLRNTPALRLYKRAGFEQTQVRIPLIRQLGAKNKKNP